MRPVRWRGSLQTKLDCGILKESVENLKSSAEEMGQSSFC